MSAYRCRVAEAMTAAREAAGVSQRELADRLGRDKRTIQKWEKGEMKIALEDFLAVFDALKVQVEPYSKWIRHPELFLNGLSDILQYSTDKKRKAQGGYYGCSAPWRSSRNITFCLLTTAATTRHVPAVDGQPADTTAGSPPHLCPDY